MKNLILTIAKSLVDKPDEVELNEIIGEKMTVFELHVAKDDLGKVIGKHGKTAQAIHTLLNATATKLKKRAVLEIIEEKGIVVSKPLEFLFLNYLGSLACFP